MAIRPNPEGRFYIGAPGATTATTADTVMNRDAFSLYNLMQLVPQPDDVGDNLTTGDVEGTEALPFRRKETDYILPMAVVGEFTIDGDSMTTAGLWFAQAISNFQWVSDNVVGPYDDVDNAAVRPGLFVVTGGDSYAGLLQVRGTKIGLTQKGNSPTSTGLVMICTMRIRIMRGSLDLVAP